MNRTVKPWIAASIVRALVYGSLLFAVVSIEPPIRVSCARSAVQQEALLGFPLPWLYFVEPNRVIRAASYEPIRIDYVNLGIDWGLAIGAVWISIACVACYRRRGIMSKPDRCRRCGYCLIGNVSGICPECGVQIDALRHTIVRSLETRPTRVHDSMTEHSPIWYFAYGANMSCRVLARRGLQPISSEAGRLDGYRLRFSHQGLIFLEPAFANIEADPDECVHGVLHKLTPGQMTRLDRMEGAEYEHIRVTVVGVSSGPVSAMAYLDPHPVTGYKPSRRYLRCCCEGACEFGLPADYIEKLIATPCTHVPILSNALNLFVKTSERLRVAGVRPERVRMALRGHAGRRDA